MKYYFLALGTLAVVCVGCATDGQDLFDKGGYAAPPAAMQMHPGPMVDGPGPGVIGMMAPAPPRAFATESTQVRFHGPDGMNIGWQIDGGFAENQLMASGRYNFRQGATYRLKLSGFPERDGMVVYPTMQVFPSHPTTDAYLSHSTVPLEIADEDLDQVEASNFVTKVIYLPDARFQEFAIAGVETLVSTRLDPGVDPVAEADRRGTIMVVLRMGNMDLETPDGDIGATGAQAAVSGGQKVRRVGYDEIVDGNAGRHAPPMPITQSGEMGVPNAMIVAGGGMPGQPTMNPISGVGGMPVWGAPITGTPIGLPGPPHLPYGGPAGLKSHEVRNLSSYDVGRPVDHLQIDVKHEPGISLPKPVRHIQYTEKHPTYKPDEVSAARLGLCHRNSLRQGVTGLDTALPQQAGHDPCKVSMCVCGCRVMGSHKLESAAELTGSCLSMLQRQSVETISMSATAKNTILRSPVAELTGLST